MALHNAAQVLSHQTCLQLVCALKSVKPVAGKGCTGLLLITVASSAKQADAPWGFCFAEQHMCAILCMNTHWEVIAHEGLNACFTGV